MHFAIQNVKCGTKRLLLSSSLKKFHYENFIYVSVRVIQNGTKVRTHWPCLEYNRLVAAILNRESKRVFMYVFVWMFVRADMKSN
jgi:hypothetical protein